jgi:transcriptional regulator with XRE-family HTH domain
MSTPQEDRDFGSRIAKLRKQRGLKQEELAAIIGRTASWLSQVERGVLPVNRLDVLRLLTDALGVPIQELRPDAPAATASSGAPGELDQVRLLITGLPTPGALLAGASSAAPADLPELRLAVERVWELTHSNEFSVLGSELQSLLPTLERATRTAPESQRGELCQLLSRTYEAMSAAFARQGEADASWLSADRAIRAAELSGDPLRAIAGAFRLAHAFVRLKRPEQAEHTAQTAIDALRSQGELEALSPAALSLLGSLCLVLAYIGARAGDREKARHEVAKARKVADRLGADRNDFNLEFGPTNVEIQAVSIAVELGDAGEAIDIGLRIDASGLSSERQARLLLDLGRAYTQRRQTADALSQLLQAEELAPELIRTHLTARKAIRELVLLAGRRTPAPLKALAERADALP